MLYSSKSNFCSFLITNLRQVKVSTVIHDPEKIFVTNGERTSAMKDFSVLPKPKYLNTYSISFPKCAFSLTTCINSSSSVIPKSVFQSNPGRSSLSMVISARVKFLRIWKSFSIEYSWEEVSFPRVSWMRREAISFICNICST